MYSVECSTINVVRAANNPSVTTRGKKSSKSFHNAHLNSMLNREQELGHVLLIIHAQSFIENFYRIIKFDGDAHSKNVLPN